MILRKQFWILALLAGCTTLGPDYSAPELTFEAEWLESGGEGVLPGTPKDLGRWWEALGDPALDGLVELALGGSLELESAFLRARQFAAIRGQVVGQRYPDVDGTGSWTRSRLGANSVPVLSDAETFDLASVGLESAWEVDLWGRITRLIEAADADLGSVVEELRDVRALLVASVASSYVELRSSQERLAVARNNIEIQRRSLELTTLRNEAGAAPALDVAQAELNLANTEATLPSLESDARQARLSLAVLVGRDPSAIAVDEYGVGGLPEIPSAIAVGVPAELLRQRPDLRAAERSLASEVARVGVEIADLYPRFQLGGSIGLESTSSGSLFDSDSGIFGFGPSFQWNLFDGGRERGEVAAQRIVAEAAYVDYRQAVLTAIEEVEGALVALDRERVRLRALERAADAARRGATLSRELYLKGKSDFQNVLDAERSLFDAEDAVIASRASLALSFISLQRALGGGWEVDADAQE